MKTMRFLIIAFFLTGLLSACSHHPDDTSRIKELEKALSKAQQNSMRLDSCRRRTTSDIAGTAITLVASQNVLDNYIDSVGRVSSSITPSSAKNKLAKYKMWQELIHDEPLDWSKESYGNLFSWDEFYAYVMYVKGKIDAQDSVYKDITGIRIYQGASFYRNSFIQDLFFIPTKGEQGLNIYDIDPDFPSFLDSLSAHDKLNFLKSPVIKDDESGVFNVSSPCPNACP